MLEQAFEPQLDLSKRGQLGMQPILVGSESTGEPAASTSASGSNPCSRTWTKYCPRLETLPLNLLLELSQLHLELLLPSLPLLPLLVVPDQPESVLLTLPLWGKLLLQARDLLLNLLLVVDAAAAAVLSA